MTEDPTRATARPVDRDVPAHGRVGPADPHADPATKPTLRPADGPVPEGPTVPTPGAPTHDEHTRPTPVGRSRTGGLWTSLILSALVLLFLLIFILQNNVPVQINFLGLSGTLPTGVALLFAAIAGLLLVAIPGGLRILQLRRAARRH
ncbi:LapA family protein [Pseudonocardia nigra]|uniref:LapA family protein n=1 Tax=Pseudonocardia nigra TaxID=1921578 RepID=UPI001C5D20FB|nr:LapA family protein [Pseudonocardia nigra]